MFQASVITSLETYDVRFPTSLHLDGSDAMNPDPDYSAAYVVLRTDAGDGLEGHGFAFTIGRGNDVQVAAIRALEPFVVGLPVDEPLADLGDVCAAARRTTRSCAGSARRRASCTWRSAPWSTRSGTSPPSARASRCGSCWPDMSPEELVDARRLPLPDRRAHARRGARDPAARASPAGRSATARAARRRATRPTPRRPAGSATPTRSSRGSARRPSPTASRRSSSRSAPTSTTTSAGCGIAREAVRPGHPDRRRRQPALGRRRRDRLDPARSRRSTRTGSRSRPAPTTSSATPRSARAVAPDPGRHRRARRRTASMFKQLLQAEAIDVVQIDAARVGGRQREHRDPAARGEVRRAGLPARRRRRPVRAGPAPGDVRLRRGLRHASRTA